MASVQLIIDDENLCMITDEMLRSAGHTTSNANKFSLRQPTTAKSRSGAFS
jgi:hypothetical protein